MKAYRAAKKLMATTTIDIMEAPFGTVVGGIKDNAETRLMVVGVHAGWNATYCLVLTSAIPWYVEGEIKPFSGDGWIVYSEEGE